MSSYVNQSMVGVDLNNASTTQQFALNTRVNGSNDSLWVYVLASGAITTGDCVSITTAGTATRCLTSGGSNPLFTDIAFAQGAISDTQYGWVAKNGNAMYVAVSGTCNASTVLYVATTSGKLHTTSASGTLMGVSILANGSSTAVPLAVTANLTWPKFNGNGN